MAYTRVNWEDLPSTNTPINATNLNKMDKGIKDLEGEIPTNDHLVNVSNEVDEDYRINVLHSKNLSNGINQFAWLNTAANSAGASASNSGLYIPVNGGTYTISSTITQERYRVACFDNLPLTTQTAYNGINKDNTSDSITIDTTGHNYLLVNATDLSKIRIAKGNTGTTENYFTPSINIDGDDISIKPTVLFNDITGLFDDIVLNDVKTNYSKLEIYFMDDQNYQNTMTIDTSNNPFQLQFVKSGANRGSMYFIATRFYYSGNTIKRGTTTIYNLISGVITENTTADVLKITKILGYK